MNKKDGKDGKSAKEHNDEDGGGHGQPSFDIVPSALDERTHEELLMLYRESTETMRFIKGHQWKTVGSTLLCYIGLIAVLRLAGPTLAMSGKFMGIVILLSVASILTLIFYQFWTHNELTKLNRMQPFMSNLFSEVRSLKSKREGNLHRYTLLSFMIIVIVLGAVVAHLAFARMTAY